MVQERVREGYREGESEHGAREGPKVSQGWGASTSHLSHPLPLVFFVAEVTHPGGKLAVTSKAWMEDAGHSRGWQRCEEPRKPRHLNTNN